VARYGQAIIPALLIITSIFGIEGSARIVWAAVRTLIMESRETGIYFVIVDGDMAWMASIVGWILGRERPRRRMSAGEPWARMMAVEAPTLPWLGPVMKKVRPWT